MRLAECWVVGLDLLKNLIKIEKEVPGADDPDARIGTINPRAADAEPTGSKAADADMAAIRVLDNLSDFICNTGN